MIKYCASLVVFTIHIYFHLYCVIIIFYIPDPLTVAKESAAVTKCLNTGILKYNLVQKKHICINYPDNSVFQK